MKEQGPLTEEQEAELAELRPKAQQWQKKKEYNAKWYQEGKTAVARVAELEALKEQGPLTEEQEAELAELQPKVAQQKQKKKEKNAKYHRAKMDAAVRVAELEALEGLTEEQAAELAELRPKAQQWQKQKERFTDWYRAGKAAAVRVVELEELKEQGLLTEAEELELAELRPKAQQWQKKKEDKADWQRAKRAAAARVAELEALEGLTEEQKVELAGLRARVAGRGREKQDREVRGTGVGGAPVVGRGVGSEGVSGWAGADQDGRDVWSADVDLDAWLARVVPDEEGVQVPQGAADAGVMLDEGAYEEFVETELLAFLGQDAATMLWVLAVLGRVPVGLISPVFSPTTPRGRDPLGCLRVKALTGCFSVSRLRGMRWGRMRGMRWGLGCGGFRSGSGGESVGVGYRFLRG